MTEDEARARAAEITDEIHVSAAQALGSITVAAEKAARDRRKDGVFWLAMVLTAVVGPALAVLFSAHNTNETELKFCTLVDASVTQAQARVQGYVDAPPTTAAGIEQATQAATAVRILTDLQHSLGCPDEKGKS